MYEEERTEKAKEITMKSRRRKLKRSRKLERKERGKKAKTTR